MSEAPPEVEVTLHDILNRPNGSDCWFVLADQRAHRALAFFAGAVQPVGIAVSLARISPRPMTFDFMASLLRATNCPLEDVRISRPENNTFYAVARVRVGGQVREVDARPSDAVPLAAVLGRPIFVAGNLLDECGEPLGPAGELVNSRQGFESLRDMWAEAPRRPTE